MHVIWINECYINKITGKDNSVIHVIRINECSINKITGKDNSVIFKKMIGLWLGLWCLKPLSTIFMSWQSVLLKEETIENH
jgi:hypothetical protein